MSDLPTGWDEAFLGDVCEIARGGSPRPIKDYLTDDPDGINWIKISDATESEKYIFKTKQKITRDGISRSRIVNDGDFILSNSMSFGRPYIVRTEGCIHDGWLVLRINDAIFDRDYLYYFLSSQAAYSQFDSMAAGSTVRNLNIDIVKTVEALIPPLNEQRRMVAKLDRLFASSRRAREELGRVSGLCDRYKQAILAAAFRGDLTADWREKNLSTFTEISLSEVCLSITDGDHQAPPKVDEGIPFITISTINDGKLKLSKATRFVSSSYFESLSPHRKPAQGDILFSVTGSIGIPVIVDTCEPFIFQRHIAILKIKRELITERYLLYILGSQQIQKQALNVATGTAQLTIPLGGLRNFKISLPAMEEQKEIVRRVEKLFKAIEAIEQEHQKASKFLDRLEQTTLAKAFRGELVPQDPNDEPASVLLEKIRAERPEQPKGKAVKSKQKSGEKS